MMRVGTELRAITRTVEQADIAAYANAAGDFNPIHLDDEFARSTQFGGTIAHGMMIASMLSELMASEFTRDWLTTGGLKIRFRTPVRPGDTVTAYGNIKGVRSGSLGTRVTCAVGVRNQNDEVAISGNATLIVSNADARTGEDSGSTK